MGRKMIGHNLLPKNRTLLLMILLRCYPILQFQLFDANTTTIHEKIDHAQFIIDNFGLIRCLVKGFPRHQNDDEQ